jgi:peptidoglycan hydrolase-like protein with peptidoglycan-binding domain
VKDGTTGIVTARDFTHDPANGADMHKIVAQLVKRRDPRIKYIIWHKQMWRSYDKPGLPAWTASAYTGTNGHTKHAHVSVKSEKASYDSTMPWGLSKSGGASTPQAPPPQKPSGSGQPTSSKFEKYQDGLPLASRVLKEGSAGNDVKWVQAKLGVRADGFFGPITEDVVMEWQKAHKLKADGIVGPLTWKALQAPATQPVKNPPVVVANPGPQSPTKGGASEFVKNGRRFPSRDGYPVYAQGYNSTTGKSEAWGSIVLASATGRDVSAIGCAMTAATMALSGISGKTITPDEMAVFMKSKNAFAPQGDLKSWDLMGTLVSPQVDLVRQTGFNAAKIDKELAAGRPVIVHVDYITKANGKRLGKYDGNGDHWFLVTGRTPDNHYQASDPAGGKLITLHRMADGRLEADAASKYGTKYRTVGNAVTFSRGPAAHVVSTKPTTSTGKPTPVVTGGKPKGPLPAFAGGDRTATAKAIQDECLRQGVTMPEQIAYVLATVQHETGNTFQPVEEAYYLGAKAEAYRKKTMRYYPYYGRGYVQLTWKGNYEKYGKLLGLDLVKNPAQALRPDVSLYVLVHGMKTGTFTSRKLSDYIIGTKINFRAARAIINGSDKADVIAEHARKWLASLKLKKVA